MKIGPEEGRLYSQKRCDIEYRSIDELWRKTFTLMGVVLFKRSDVTEVWGGCSISSWRVNTSWHLYLNFGVRCGRPGQSGQEVWDISLTPWVISEGNGFTQFKPVKNTELIGKEVPSPLSSNRAPMSGKEVPSPLSSNRAQRARNFFSN